jgi:hypothetical protein
MTGLMISGAPLSLTPLRVNRANVNSKSKGRKPNRPARILPPSDHHDSTTESDESASAGT